MIESCPWWAQDAFFPSRQQYSVKWQQQQEAASLTVQNLILAFKHSQCGWNHSAIQQFNNSAAANLSQNSWMFSASRFQLFFKPPLLWVVQMGDFFIFSSDAEHIAERKRLLQLVHTQVTENEKFSQSTVKGITFEWCQNTRSSDLSDRAVLWKYNLLFFPKRKVQQMTGNTPRTSF